MTDHLPECPHTEPHLNPGFLVMCICDRLRACEQRVLEDQAWVDHAREIEAHARSLALDAAREAVAAVDEGPKDRPYWIDREAALAAIDALRKEQK